MLWQEHMTWIVSFNMVLDDCNTKVEKTANMFCDVSKQFPWEVMS